jgi:hypothetical protein
MPRIRRHCTIVLLAFCAAFAGCKGAHSLSSGGSTGGTGTAPVVLAMTDTPPTNVSILAAEVTLTGATLNPGSVPVFSGPATVELTRLQTDIAYLATTKVAPGTYTSLTLTFSNPMLTFENDTGGSVSFGVGSPKCLAGAICTIQSVATNLSTTITLSNFALSANTGAGLLVDVNLNNLLSPTLGADFIAGSTVSQFTPAGSGAPPVGAEDVVGQVGAINTTNNTFSLQNATATYSLTVDNTSTFVQFHPSLCTTSTFACLRNGQILSVDISFRADGTAVARNLIFEEPDSTRTVVEGIITSINSGGQQFTMVTLVQSAPISNLHIGDSATVHYNVSPPTPFAVDFTHADSTPVTTTGFLFSSPADLIVGQQVLVLENPASAGASITADQVLLRSSRVSGQALSGGTTTLFNLGALPSIFTVHVAPQIQVQTSLPTICTGTGVGTISNCSLLALTPQHTFSVRGPFFANSKTLIASKVVQH